MEDLTRWGSDPQPPTSGVFLVSRSGDMENSTPPPRGCQIGPKPQVRPYIGCYGRGVYTGGYLGKRV